jgi:hypothetical protein
LTPYDRLIAAAVGMQERRTPLPDFQRRIRSTASVLLASSCAWPLTAVAQSAVQKSLDTASDTVQSSARSQQKIDQLSEQTREMLENYRQAIRKTQQLQVYNRELERIVSEQRGRRDRLAARIEDVGGLGEEIEPLTLRMIDGLARFIEADLPFRAGERKARIDDLRQTMSDPETSLAEKYRKVLEAYQAEAVYGRTMDTYRGEIPRTSGEGSRLVEFLRVGRVMLFYLTPDEAEAGYWDREAGEWRVLDGDYRDAIRRGIRVARDVAAPQLVEIAVPAPRVADDGEQP